MTTADEPAETDDYLVKLVDWLREIAEPVRELVPMSLNPPVFDCDGSEVFLWVDPE